MSKRKQKDELELSIKKTKKTPTDGNSLLCILYSSNVLQPGNFISLINGMVMPAKTEAYRKMQVPQNSVASRMLPRIH